MQVSALVMILTGCVAYGGSQLLILVLQTNSAEFGITVAAIPVVLFLLIGAGFAVQREIKWYVTLLSS